jgi:membrane protease YdiL (CAAX protease family)
MHAERLIHLLAEASPSVSLMLISGSVLAILIGLYGWLAHRSSYRAILTTRPFGIPDAICAGILALWMISIIWGSLGAERGITLRAILGNSILYACLIFGIFGIIGFQRNSPIALFGLELKSLPKAAGTGLIWLIATYPLILAAQWFTQAVFGESDGSQKIVRYFLEHPDPRHRIGVILMAVVVAPVAEEIIFRGYFYGVIRRFGGRIPALLTSSLLFAAIHVHLPSMLGLGLLAVILCLLYERTGSLWATMTMHAAFNATTIAALIFFPELAG